MMLTSTHWKLLVPSPYERLMIFPSIPNVTDTPSCCSPYRPQCQCISARKQHLTIQSPEATYGFRVSFLQHSSQYLLSYRVFSLNNLVNMFYIIHTRVGINIIITYFHILLKIMQKAVRKSQFSFAMALQQTAYHL